MMDNHLNINLNLTKSLSISKMNTFSPNVMIVTVKTIFPNP